MIPVLTLHNPEASARYYAEGTWTADTFYSLLANHAEKRPNAPALRDSARRLTWGRLKARVDAAAAALVGAGLAKGERLAFMMSNRAEGVIVMLAAARNAYICNPSLHQNFTVEEVLAFLGHLGAKALVHECGYGADADKRDLLEEAGKIKALKGLFALAPGRGKLENFMPAGEHTAPEVNENPDKICYLAFTSGTTGNPKGVMHSDNTLMANARDMVKSWGHNEDSIILSLSPISHHIFWVAMAQALVAGCELVINDPSEDMTPLDWIVEVGATYVMGVPTHAMDILADQKSRGMESLGAVKMFYMAGASIPISVARAFLDQGIKPQNVYGMTENSSHHFTWPNDPPDIICATCGRGGKAYEVKIFDTENSDVEVPAGEVGQIGGKGAALMLGYFANQEATQGSFNSNGWFLSGDLGRLDENGCLVFAGRLKDMIIRGGRNIYPARIENLAHHHANIDKAAAFPIADKRLGEKVCLAVLPAGEAPAADEILAHLFEAGLSKHDMPEYYIVMDDLPLTASGKILKRELAEWVRQGEILPDAVRWTGPD